MKNKLLSMIVMIFLLIPLSLAFNASSSNYTVDNIIIGHIADTPSSTSYSARIHSTLGSFSPAVNSSLYVINTGYIYTLSANQSPSITDKYSNPRPVAFNQTITIRATVTDTDNDISQVNFTIIAPNGTYVLNNTQGTNQGSYWESNSYKVTKYGQWNVTVNVTDSDNNLVSTTYNFKSGLITKIFYTKEQNTSQQTLWLTDSYGEYNLSLTAPISSSTYAISVNASYLGFNASKTANLTVTGALISIVSPTNNSQVAAGTTWTWINITTTANANCRYNLTNETFNYATQATPFTTTGTTAHWFNYSGLSNENNYTLYYKCNDTSGNINSLATTHKFNIPAANTAPTLTTPQIIPASPSANTTLNCSTNVTDDTSLTINVTFRWYKNSILKNFWTTTVPCDNNTVCYTNKTVNPGIVTYDSTWNCTARGYDSQLYSSWSSSSLVAIGNASGNYSNCPSQDGNETGCLNASCVWNNDTQYCNPDWDSMDCDDHCGECLTLISCNLSIEPCAWDSNYSFCYTNFSSFNYSTDGTENSSGYYNFTPIDCNLYPESCDSQYDVQYDFFKIETNCFDNVDEDYDSKVDCNDEDCRLWPSCSGVYNPASDTQPPRIKHHTKDVTTNSSLLMWITTEPTNASVYFYDTSSTCAVAPTIIHEPDNPNIDIDNYIPDHYMLLDPSVVTNILATTTYYYKLIGYDQAGLEYRTTCLNFTTPNADSNFTVDFDSNSDFDIEFDFGTGYQNYNFSEARTFNMSKSTNLRFANQGIEFQGANLGRGLDYNITNAFSSGTSTFIPNSDYISMTSIKFFELKQKIGLSRSANITIVIPSTGKRVYKCNDNGSICQEVTQFVTINSFNTTHTNVSMPISLSFSSYTVGNNARLEIWDQTDNNTFYDAGQSKYVNNLVNFYANYTNSTLPNTAINDSGTYCQTNITGSWTNMSFNTSNNLYWFNTTFATTGIISYNTSCYDNNGIFDNLSTTDTVNITNNIPLIPVLSAPNAGNLTVNRTPTFYWFNSTDADNDNITYQLQVDTNLSFPSPIINVSNINETTNGSTNYTITTELTTDVPYFWRVRANDGTNNSNWSTTRNLTVESQIYITFIESSVDFGPMLPGDTNDTTDNNPRPFVIRSDGNILTNITITATSIWTQQTSPTPYYMYKITPNESNSYLSATTNFTNMNITSSRIDITNLNYSDTNDTAEIEINLTVPADEAPGAKGSIITITAS